MGHCSVYSRVPCFWYSVLICKIGLAVSTLLKRFLTRAYGDLYMRMIVEMHIQTGSAPGHTSLPSCRQPVTQYHEHVALGQPISCAHVLCSTTTNRRVLEQIERVHWAILAIGAFGDGYIYRTTISNNTERATAHHSNRNWAIRHSAILLWGDGHISDEILQVFHASGSA